MEPGTVSQRLDVTARIGAACFGVFTGFLGGGAEAVQIERARGSTGIEFVPNRGQFGVDVRFVLESGPIQCSLLGAGIRYHLVEDWKPLTNPTGRPDWPVAVPIYRAVTMTFEGANPEAAVEGTEIREPIVSYFLGNDPTRWVSGLPTFGGVRFRDLYPGIDMQVVYDPRGLEYDLMLRPGSDPMSPVLRIDGAKVTDVTADGSIRIRTEGGAELVQLPPRSYEVSADGSRRPLASRFIDLGNHRFQLQLPDWNGSSPAVVDPIVAQPQGFTYLGGVGAEFGFDVSTFVGKPVMTGCTSSPFALPIDDGDFPISTTAFQISYSGALSGYISGFSSDLWQLKWTTFFGIPEGESSDEVVVPHGVSLDGEGSVYIGGYTNSLNLPTTTGAVQANPLGLGDGFVAKLSSNGSNLVYSTYITSSMFDTVEDVAVSPNGRAYVVGYATATAAILPPTTSGVVEPVIGAGGPYIGYAAKLNDAGTSFDYLTFVGSAAESTRPRAIALDFDDADPSRILAVIAGDVRGNGLQTPGGFDSTVGGTQDAFVAVLNHDASSWLFGSYLGGQLAGPSNRSDEWAWGVSVNPAHLIAVTGQSESTDLPVTGGAFQASLSGNDDAFVARIDRLAVNPLVYASYYGGNTGECGLDIAIDASGAIYATGWTTSLAGLPIVNPFMSQPATSGGRDAFVLKVRNSALQLSSYLGGSGIDCGNGIVLEPGAFFVCGTTLSADFPVNLGAAIGFDQLLSGSGGTETVTSMPLPQDWDVDQSSLAQFPRGDAFLVRFELP